MGNKHLLKELWDFLKVRKAWWLAPIIISLIIVSLLIVLGESILPVWVYTLF